MTRLPGILAEIADVAGKAAALQLMASHGGRRVYIPVAYTPSCWLHDVVGEVAARAIIAHFKGFSAAGDPARFEMEIPIGDMGTFGRARKQAGIAFAKAIEEGCGARTAGYRAGVSARTAWNMKRRLKGRKDDGQGSLF
jgi:hypothetical protein